MRAAAALALLALAPVHAADWIRLETPHLEILTDAGERTGRRVLDRLEQIRQILPAGARDGRLSLRVAIFKSKDEFLGFAPIRSADGFYQTGLERDYIVAHSSAPLSRVVVHEYVHFVLHQDRRELPNWFDEGLAEFYSNVEIRGNRLRLGEPLDTHLALLQRERWLDAATMLAPPPADEQQRTGSVYYAESWALVHMLNLSPDYRAGVPRFAELLAAGRTDTDAFAAAFGRSFPQALADLRTYVARGPRSVTVDAPPLEETAAPEPERLDALDALLARGELALRCGRIDTARPLYERAAREHPDDARAESGLGTLAMAAGDRDQARAHLDRSLELDPTSAAAWFEYAMLEQDDGAGFARISELLEHVVSLNPDVGQAHLLLGVRATDDDDLVSAVEHLRAATRLMPRKSDAWHALAYAELKRGDTGEALRAARQAVRTAASESQARMAGALLDALVDGRVP